MTAVPRPARPGDAEAIRDVEDRADALLVDRLRPDEWRPAPSGALRMTGDGFVLVVEAVDEVVGFVHVIETTDLAHLEQLSVHPDHGQRGLGRLLLRAAKEEARRRGHGVLTLRTFAEVPWNAPFYASEGFEEQQPRSAFHRELVAVEAGAGLDALGRRVLMGVRL